MAEKNILVVSHNVFGNTDNMGKFLRDTFVKWDANHIGQIYIYNEVPQCSTCFRYYRITDFEVLSSIYTRRSAGHVIFTKDQFNIADMCIERKHNNAYQIGKTKKAWTYLLRNFIWSIGKWKSKELDLWIRELKPDLIYFASGEYTFLYKVVNWLSIKYNLPVFTAIYDDFYFSAKPSGILSLYNIAMYKNELRRLLKKSFQVSYASDTMKRLYDKEFCLNGFVQYKSTKNNDIPEIVTNTPIITYAGGLSLNRWKSLLKIGQAIRDVFPESNVYLDVYSGEKDPDIVGHLIEKNGIRFRGFVEEQELSAILNRSNILVIVESFDKEIRDRIRCSLSTKIADYIGKNRTIFAYGPSDVGSIEYLRTNECAFVVSEEKWLKDTLFEAFNNIDKKKYYLENAKLVAFSNHSKDAVDIKLRKAINGLSK